MFKIIPSSWSSDLLPVCWQEEKIQFAVEALRRASAKFAGRQKVHVSNKFGFTKYTKKDGMGRDREQGMSWAQLKTYLMLIL